MTMLCHILILNINDLNAAIKQNKDVLNLTALKHNIGDYRLQEGQNNVFSLLLLFYLYLSLLS